MNSVALTVVNSELWTGIPFVIQVRGVGPEALPKELSINPLGVEGAQTFVAPVKNQGHSLGTTELSLELPGRYRVQVLGSSVMIEVRQRHDLSFGVEFGLFSVAVIILVGGMLVWLRRRRYRLVRSA